MMPVISGACESGDLHTEVAKLVSPPVVKDRTSAEAISPRHFAYQDMSKRGGHLSNYMGKPPRMAQALKLKLSRCVEWDQTYYKSFGLPTLPSVGSEGTALKAKASHTTWNEEEDSSEILMMTRYFAALSLLFLNLLSVSLLLSSPTSAGVTFLRSKPLTHDHDGFTFQFADDSDLEQRLFAQVKALADIKLTCGSTSHHHSTRLFLRLELGSLEQIKSRWTPKMEGPS